MSSLPSKRACERVDLSRTKPPADRSRLADEVEAVERAIDDFQRARHTGVA